MANSFLRTLLFATALAAPGFSVTAQSADILPVPKDAAKSQADWYNQGKSVIQQKLAIQKNEKRAKNVILFVGDGMGISTLTAGRIFEGQQNGVSGEENYLSFEKFPYTALVKTYNTDAQVPDSAGTATSLNSGSKARIGAVNTPPHIAYDQCSTDEADKMKTLAMRAEERGMATGIVSTARLTHATPAAVYAVASNRNWELDTKLPDNAVKQGCADIASQITGDLGGDGLEVALGGGRANFLPKEGGEYGKGWREDKKDIVSEWVNRQQGGSFVSNRDELLAAENDGKPLLGLFSNSHMSFSADEAKDEPTLAEMTEVAIKRLSKSDGGYYLMVEAGRIDHAHHDGNAARSLADVEALSAAVRKALSLVDIEETTILVTADHSHVFTMAGYPVRGNHILGLSRNAMDEERKPYLAKDGKPYTTLGYMNGPGAVKGERPTITQEEAISLDYKQQALIPTGGETHGGEDVALFAIGPWAHLARGTIEQNVVYHIMHHALDLDNR